MLILQVQKLFRDNTNLSFQGVIKRGPFDVNDSSARAMLRDDPMNQQVLKPIANGLDITRRPRNMWIIDFGVDTPIAEALRYSLPFKHVEDEGKTIQTGDKASIFKRVLVAALEQSPQNATSSRPSFSIHLHTKSC